MSAVEAAIGLTKAALDTPALIVDREAMGVNIARLVQTCRANGVNWRPHVKGQKTPEIALEEIAAGAIGVTCAKLGEAEVMAEAGIHDLLIANQIVGSAKIARLIELCGHADPIVAIDDLANAAELAAAATARDRRLRVVIEVDIGMRRAGVMPGAPVVALANAIAAHPALAFVGVMGWESHATTIVPAAAKRDAVAAAIGLLTGSADICRDAGHNVTMVSCGGTGTFPYCAEQPGVTEIQAGGGIFGDVHYRTHHHVDFVPALTLMATVTSRPTPTRIIVDAGRKALSSDAAMPRPLGLGPVADLRLSAEHATIELAAAADRPRIGDRLEFAVGYSDTTVHLHDEMFGVRNGRVDAVWTIAGRGRLR